MNDTANKALKMLGRKLDILKNDSSNRGRQGVKMYLEECIALLEIVERNKDET